MTCCWSPNGISKHCGWAGNGLQLIKQYFCSLEIRTVLSNLTKTAATDKFVSNREMSSCLQYSYFISLIVVPQSPRHPCLAEETEGDLCSVFWLVAPGGRSPHHHHCAAAFCLNISTFKNTYHLLILNARPCPTADCVNGDNDHTVFLNGCCQWLIKARVTLLHLFESIFDHPALRKHCRYCSPVFSQHMMTLYQSRWASFVFARTRLKNNVC